MTRIAKQLNKLALFILGMGIALPAALAKNDGQFGPFDYYDTAKTPAHAYAVVERAHFGPKTELFRRQGNWCAYWADLDYTLRAFPNHPKALVAMAEFLKTQRPCDKAVSKRPSRKKSAYGMLDDIENRAWRKKDAEYYFETAIEYQPIRTEPRILYGRYLIDAGKPKEAIGILKEAQRIDPKSVDIHYYLGLAQFKLGNIDEAKIHAETAYKLGQPPAELRRLLVAAGVWKSE